MPTRFSMGKGNDMATRELTGKKVFIIVASAFGLIISVNLLMAFKAISTFPGLEVQSSYIANQTFDLERAAQERLGWQVSAVAEGENLRLSIRDAAGNPVEAREIGGILGRPTSTAQDTTPQFRFDGRDYLAEAGALAPGNWNFRMQATAYDGTEFRRRVVFHVKEE